MLEINLLTWREEKRLRHKKIINYSLTVAIFMLCGLFAFLHVHLKMHLIQQEKKVAALKQRLLIKQLQAQEVRALEKQYTHLLSIDRYITKLNRTEDFFIFILSGMLNQTPSEIKITYLERKKGRYVMLGQTPSTLIVAEWLKQFPQAQLVAMKQISPSILNFKIVI